MVLQLGVAFLNRFVAKRGSMYSESLMTEGIAMPVVVIFCVELCKWFYYGYKKDLISASLLAILALSFATYMWGRIGGQTNQFYEQLGRYEALTSKE